MQFLRRFREKMERYIVVICSIKRFCVTAFNRHCMKGFFFRVTNVVLDELELAAV
jgi:hypothetical protein